ncbi:MAG: replicative DNA helicase [Erysipelotrichaceae bacterium]|jgi:replicative DNA helicase|nr:replicative DNA helicase [Erysipelotrichaceae bacterium]
MAKKKKDLPYNLEAEKAVLGSALLAQDALFNVVSSLEAEDFYDERNKTVYESILSLLSRRLPVDILTVATELDAKKELDNVGGTEYLKDLTEWMISFANLQAYIDIVLDQSIMRKMLTSIRTINDRFMSDDIANANDFILDSEVKFRDSIARRHVSSFTDMTTATNIIKQQLEAKKDVPQDEAAIDGLTSGYNRIDAYTQGFKKGELTIVAARPSVGKTALALNFAYNVARKENVSVAIFSLEMTTDLLVKRLLASQSSVNLQYINSGRIYEKGDKTRVAEAIREISSTKIFIDDTSGLKLMDILAKTQKLQSANPDLGLVIIDYLGLVQLGSNSRNPDSRQEEVRKISLALKGMAKDLKVPVVVVSQLSRDVEKRDTKKPMLSDLRDSGSIEQDADVVMLLYREDYYDGQKKQDLGNKKVSKMSERERFDVVKVQKASELKEALPPDSSYVEVNIAKNRNGRTGRVPLLFYKSYGRFDEPTQAFVDAMKELTDSEE